MNDKFCNFSILLTLNFFFSHLVGSHVMPNHVTLLCLCGLWLILYLDVQATYGQ